MCSRKILLVPVKILLLRPTYYGQQYCFMFLYLNPIFIDFKTSGTIRIPLALKLVQATHARITMHGMLLFGKSFHQVCILTCNTC